MDSIAKLESTERKELFSETASKMGLVPAVIEKDFWVCYVLGKLFSSDQLKDKILFKGGTSLSKVFGLIKRFSEDIDLVLDWSELTADDPYEERSRSEQVKFNKKLNELACDYLVDKFAPSLKETLTDEFKLNVDRRVQSVLVKYPSGFDSKYVRPEICLEIGPLASWVPHGNFSVKPFAADIFPSQFAEPSVNVKAINSERTFWEKITILHHEAHRPVGNEIPTRYSRHYYDIIMMSKHAVKENAFADLNLLSDVVKFKEKFYYRAWAKYELAKPGTMKLYPPHHCIEILRKDYKAMEGMIFDVPPTFDELMSCIRKIESEINELV
ncbi:MAG: nucleotidyl transferase AbiEii/AbiGii toxin family protein [candidate division Zixibacteria bacterium]|nr:nucleotidyl transferase AbiEii/AbiGii toxin family protein [candidate division Zixibacteria bacterium]